MEINTEQRFYNKSEIRVQDGDEPTLSGIAVPYDSYSQVLSDPKTGRAFVEVVKAGAFARTLGDPNAEVKADIGHDREKVIGRRSKGTVTLEDKPEGLSVTIKPPKNTLGNDAIESVRHGDVEGLSMQFRVNAGGEAWDKTTVEGKTLWRRTLTDLQLERVALTAEPAYPSTSVAVRSLEAAEQAEAKADAEKTLAETPKDEGEVTQNVEVKEEGLSADTAKAKLKVLMMKAGEY